MNQELANKLKDAGFPFRWCSMTHEHTDMWRFSRNIHGHTHGNEHRAEEYTAWYSKDYHIDISPEIVGYAPLRLETLLKQYRR